MIRFNRIGVMYYLGTDNCVYSSKKVKLLCDVTNFEVTIDGKIVALTDYDKPAGNDGRLLRDPVSRTVYTKYNIYRDLTLYRDKPIFVDLNNRTSSAYGSEKIVSITTGVDGAMWALGYRENSTDYPVYKWQDIVNKWYLIEGVYGKEISAYNEISLAVLNSTGMILLSSSEEDQDEVDYTASVNTQVPTTPPDDENGDGSETSVDGEDGSETPEPLAPLDELKLLS